MATKRKAVGPIGPLFSCYLELPLLQAIIDHILESGITPSSPTPTGCLNTFLELKSKELFASKVVPLRTDDEVYTLLDDRNFIKRSLQQRLYRGKETN